MQGRAGPPFRNPPSLSGTFGGPAVHPFGPGCDAWRTREDGLTQPTPRNPHPTTPPHGVRTPPPHPTKSAPHHRDFAGTPGPRLRGDPGTAISWGPRARAEPDLTAASSSSGSAVDAEDELWARRLDVARDRADGGADREELHHVVLPHVALHLQPRLDHGGGVQPLRLRLHPGHRQLPRLVHRLREDGHLGVLAGLAQDLA